MAGSDPILVTGVPRSGTTWLARLLADAPGTSLTGREPMNPRGRQHALGGSLARWTRLSAPTGRQGIALRSAYAGLNPLAYSRYGHRQWAGFLPGRRIIVKDPFALLSLPAVAAVCRATPVLVYRHPGAVLASYRRMGWSVDLDEVASSLREDAWPPALRDELIPRVGRVTGKDDVEQMAAFWEVLHRLALADLPDGSLIVSHGDLAASGVPGARQLFTRLGLKLSSAAAEQMTRISTQERPTSELHHFDRNPAEVAESWRSRLEPEAIGRLDDSARAVLTELDQRRVQFRPDG